MSWQKVIVVLTVKVHCFHDYIYVMPILLLWDLSTLCVVDHLWSLILRFLLNLLSTLWFIGFLLKYMSWLKAIVVITGGHIVFTCINILIYIRCASRPLAKSKMELPAISLNLWKLLIDATKNSVSDTAGVLDTPPCICPPYIHITKHTFVYKYIYAYTFTWCTYMYAHTYTHIYAHRKYIPYYE